MRPSAFLFPWPEALAVKRRTFPTLLCPFKRRRGIGVSGSEVGVLQRDYSEDQLRQLIDGGEGGI